MCKRFLLWAIVALIIILPLNADELKEPVSVTGISDALSVIMDCLSASVVSEYSAEDVILPCTSISYSPQTSLPQRIVFFLADPYDITSSMVSVYGNKSGNFFTDLFNSFYRTTKYDPLMEAVLSVMKSKYNKALDYIISGSIYLQYPEEATLGDIADLLVSKSSSDGYGVKVFVNLTLSGNKINDVFRLQGNFEMETNNSGIIILYPVDTYTINNYYYTGGEFHY